MMLNNYTVPNKELRVTMSMRFDAEDLGAQNSSTETAHKGIKPKTFSVSLVVPFDRENLLSELIAVAETVEDTGELTVYDITDSTANSVGVRQVKFTDNFTAREASNIKAWQVSFSLQEYQSTPEKVEERQETSEPEEQAAEGAAVSAAEESTEEEQQLSWFERQLLSIDKALS